MLRIIFSGMCKIGYNIKRYEYMRSVRYAEIRKPPIFTSYITFLLFSKPLLLGRYRNRAKTVHQKTFLQILSIHFTIL